MDRLNGNEEVLSAWFDDESAEPATDLDLEAILRDPNTRSTWGTYALIGAALRGEPLATLSDGFVAAVLQRIAEPGSEAPPQRELARLADAAGGDGTTPVTAANDAWWRWSAVAATLVAVVVTGVLALQSPREAGVRVAEREMALRAESVAFAPAAMGGQRRLPTLPMGVRSVVVAADAGVQPVRFTSAPFYMLAHNPAQPMGGVTVRALATPPRVSTNAR